MDLIYCVEDDEGIRDLITYAVKSATIIVISCLALSEKLSTLQSVHFQRMTLNLLIRLSLWRTLSTDLEMTLKIVI